MRKKPARSSSPFQVALFDEDFLLRILGEIARVPDVALYLAVFAALGVPLGGEGPGFFWADELFVSIAESRHAHGKATGRAHFAFQAKDREAIDRVTTSASTRAARTMATGRAIYHPGYYAAFCWTPTATTSKWYRTARDALVGVGEAHVLSVRLRLTSPRSMTGTHAQRARAPRATPSYREAAPGHS